MTASQGLAAISPHSRISLRPLSVVPEGEEFLVGNAACGVFVTIPAIGVEVLRHLEAGATVSATADALARSGQNVDVLDFVHTLRDLGLVTAVDGHPIADDMAVQAGAAWLAAVPPALVRPLFSRWAWSLYGLLFLACAVLFVVRPVLWPSFEDFFFSPNPAVCAVVVAFLSFGLGAGHELCHWLAGRAAGVAARFRVGRRLLVPVLETDLTQLWSLPRQERYSPFLAGMAFDTVVLAVSLGLRAAGQSGMIAMAPLLERFLGTVVLIQVFSLAWQFMFHMRTDLYAVLITALGCTNLYRGTYLTMLKLVRRLGPDGAAELALARPADLRVARWFVWLYLGGLALYAWFFVQYFIPGTFVMGGWVLGSLRGAGPGSAAFWEALVIGLIALVQGLVPLALYLWERLARRGEVAS